MKFSTLPGIQANNLSPALAPWASCMMGSPTFDIFLKISKNLEFASSEKSPGLLLKLCRRILLVKFSTVYWKMKEDCTR